MANPTVLFLMRHGEVEDRYHRVFAGRMDIDLSPRGHEQAARLAQYARRWGLEAIYSSTLRRARQTTAPLARTLGLEPVFLDELQEADFGEWTGLNHEQVHAQSKSNALEWLSLLESGGIPGAEAFADLQARLKQATEQVLQQHAGKKVALVYHGGAIRGSLSTLLGISLAKTAYFGIDYASSTQVEVSPQKTCIRLLNFTPWRDWP